MLGELVMGRFRVLDRVGSGAMGTVYRAFDERLQRQVAVKEIAGTDARRVLREAQAAARLNHPGIVTLYELGSEGDRALLVSELVDGATLADLAQSEGLSDREAAEFGADICEALTHAHERGVIHRDVKPQNVIVRADDGAGRQAKLMDFGIASLAGASALTATGEVVGTLAYMAPEQAEGEPAGEPADTYSLALTLYELWAGTNPVARATPAQTAREIGQPLPSLREYRPDLPVPLASSVDACLGPQPDLRPPLAELHSELMAALPSLDDHRRGSPAARRQASRARRRLAAGRPAGGAYGMGPGRHRAGRGARAPGACPGPRRLDRSRHPRGLTPGLGPAARPGAAPRRALGRPRLSGRRGVSWDGARARSAWARLAGAGCWWPRRPWAWGPISA